MIQRPQTLFFLAGVAICLMMMLSDTVYYTIQNPENSEMYSVEFDETEIIANDGRDKMNNTWAIVFIGLSATLSLVSIFLFKNRKTQLLVASVNYLVILGIAIMLYVYSLYMGYFEEKGLDGDFTMYAAIPLALLVFNFLASKGIQRDEKLVRSMDRLR